MILEERLINPSVSTAFIPQAYVACGMWDICRTCHTPSSGPNDVDELSPGSIPALRSQRASCAWNVVPQFRILLVGLRAFVFYWCTNDEPIVQILDILLPSSKEATTAFQKFQIASCRRIRYGNEGTADMIAAVECFGW